MLRIKNRLSPLDSTLFLLVLFGTLIAYCAPSASAAEFATLLLSAGQRATIDQQRVNYLKAKTLDDKKSSRPIAVKKEMDLARNQSPHNISVTAVIVKPNGERIVRINNRFQKVPIATENKEDN